MTIEDPLEEFNQNAKALPPTLSIYQIYILSLISYGEMKGADIRKKLFDRGFQQVPSSFSVSMQRLEKHGFLDSRCIPIEKNGRKINEKHFVATGKGISSVEAAVEFFREFSEGLKKLPSVEKKDWTP